jgi:predicted ribosomally synthesized peptide with nif11-like leader
MSTDCARGFLLRMKSDLDFFFRVAAIEDAGERLAFIRSQGFDCTEQEIVDSFSSPHDLPPEVDRKAWKGHLPADPEFICRATTDWAPATPTLPVPVLCTPWVVSRHWLCP